MAFNPRRGSTIFELNNEYITAIQIHPYDGENDCLKINTGGFIWFDDAQRRYTSHLYIERSAKQISKIKNKFCTRGMLGVANYGRRVHGFDGRPDLLKTFKTQETPWSQKHLF